MVWSFPLDLVLAQVCHVAVKLAGWFLGGIAGHNLRAVSGNRFTVLLAAGFVFFLDAGWACFAWFVCDGRFPVCCVLTGLVILVPLLGVAFQSYRLCPGSCVLGPLLGVTIQFCGLRGGLICCWLICLARPCFVCHGVVPLSVSPCLHAVLLGMLCRLRAAGMVCVLFCLRCLWMSLFRLLADACACVAVGPLMMFAFRFFMHWGLPRKETN